MLSICVMPGIYEAFTLDADDFSMVLPIRVFGLYGADLTWVSDPNRSVRIAGNLDDSLDVILRGMNVTDHNQISVDYETQTITGTSSALHVTRSDLSLRHMAFTENGSIRNGGAVKVGYSSTLSVENSLFANNVTNGHGGAIWKK